MARRIAPRQTAAKKRHHSRVRRRSSQETPPKVAEAVRTQLDHALAMAGDGAFVSDDDGRIVFWNPAAEKILGYTAREMVGRPCHEAFAGRDEQGHRLCYENCHVRRLLKLDEPVHDFTMQTTAKSGAPVWLNVSVLSVSPVTMHLFRDITAQHQLVSLLRERLSTVPSPTPEGPRITEMLTSREGEVLKLLGSGVNTRSVAQRLHLSPATVRNHMQHVLAKLGVHSRLEAVAFAMRCRWL